MFRGSPSTIEAVRKTRRLGRLPRSVLSNAGRSSICPNSEHILLDNVRVKGILVFLNMGGNDERKLTVDDEIFHRCE